MDFNLQPILEDDVLLIRPLAEEDFQDLFTVASDPLIWEQHQNKNRFTIDAFTDFFKEGIASKGALAILDKHSKRIIGSSRYKMIPETEGVVEIGWSFLARAFWGGSYNKRFKKLMINYALQYGKHVVFYVNSGNFRSQKAMEKLGGRKWEDTHESWVLPIDKGVTYVIDKPL